MIRSRISKDADDAGPVFLPDEDRQQMAQAQAQFLSVASEVLKAHLAAQPSVHLAGVSRDESDGRTTVTAVVRTPSPIEPVAVAQAEEALRAALGVPVALVVQSVYAVAESDTMR